jgi:hypothetical protein
MRKALIVLVIITLLSLSSFSLELTDLSGSESEVPLNTNTQNLSISKSLINVLNDTKEIKSTLNNFVVKQELKDAVNYLDIRIVEKSNFLVLVFSIELIFALILAYAYYFILKAKRRI